MVLKQIDTYHNVLRLDQHVLLWNVCLIEKIFYWHCPKKNCKFKHIANFHEIFCLAKKNLKMFKLKIFYLSFKTCSSCSRSTSRKFLKCHKLLLMLTKILHILMKCVTIPFYSCIIINNARQRGKCWNWLDVGQVESIILLLWNAERRMSEWEKLNQKKTSWKSQGPFRYIFLWKSSSYSWIKDSMLSITFPLNITSPKKKNKFMQKSICCSVFYFKCNTIVDFSLRQTFTLNIFFYVITKCQMTNTLRIRWTSTCV